MLNPVQQILLLFRELLRKVLELKARLDHLEERLARLETKVDCREHMFVEYNGDLVSLADYMDKRYGNDI